LRKTGIIRSCLTAFWQVLDGTNSDGSSLIQREIQAC